MWVMSGEGGVRCGFSLERMGLGVHRICLGRVGFSEDGFKYNKRKKG
jgi:hypothetical protein